MLCAISGEAPQEPVASRKSGNVFEKRLIEAHIAEHHTDPVTGEDLSVEDLIELKSPRIVTPRPPHLTSIPALLTAFQTEWDAIVLESFTLKQQLAQTRQELSTALYQNDAATRVIARLTQERDDARQALSSVTVSAGGANGDSMDVDAQALPEELVAKVDEKQQQYVLNTSLRRASLTLIDFLLPVRSAQSQKAGLPQRRSHLSTLPIQSSPFILVALLSPWIALEISLCLGVPMGSLGCTLSRNKHWSIH
jgi:hypothetical protein